MTDAARMNRLLVMSFVCTTIMLCQSARATDRLSPLSQSQNRLMPLGDASAAAKPLRSVLVVPHGQRDQWHAARIAVDLPLGNPLTDPLNYSAAEQLLFADAVDGKLDGTSLLDAALVACGVDQSDARDRYNQKFAELRQELQQLISAAEELSTAVGDRPAEVERKIYAIHRVLHQFVLSNYNAEATNLAATLDTGVYNCASAALLVLALADEVGLAAKGVEFPGHVRVVIETSAGYFELEATCPRWQEAIRWNAKSASNGALTVVENGSRREVSALGLIAMIYYNRGIDAFEQHLFADAVAANRRALRLDPNNAAARGNLLAAVNNWALALSDVKYFAEAIGLLDAGRRFDPKHTAFAQNSMHVQRLQTSVGIEQ